MPPEVFVLVGLDCDRPRLDHRALNVERHESELISVLSYLTHVVQDDASPDMTLFINGLFAESCFDAFGPLAFSWLSEAEGVEVACHSYAHRPYDAVTGRPDLDPLTLREIREDLGENLEMLRRISPDQSHFGFRAPYGHTPAQDGADWRPLVASTRHYSSSILRSNDADMSLHAGGQLRPPDLAQPYLTPSGIWEFPSSGWQDTAFLPGSLSAGRRPAETAIEHYQYLIQQALDRSHATSLFVTLVLHPFAMRIYDPGRRMLSELVSHFSAQPVRWVTHSEALRELCNT